jgi:Flp pilus assembly protein TadD
MVALGRATEAESYFEQAVRAAPNDPEALTRLGLAKFAGGDTTTAVGLFKLALTISPGYPPAAQALARATAK